MTPKLARILLVVASVLSFLVGCATPALHLTGKANTRGEQTTMSGLAAFFTGFFGMLAGQYAWLANPLGITAIVLLFLRCYNAALICSVAALFAAQHTWVLVGTIISGDEGGVTKYLVTSLGLGFYLWVLGFLLVAVASLVRERRTVGM